MAKQTIAPFFVGTIDFLTFYEMYGRYYARAKSSLTADRVKTDACFIPTMLQAAFMAHASRIGSALYALVPRANKQHSLYRTLTGQANLRLKKGMTEDTIVAQLIISHIIPLRQKRVKALLKQKKAARRKSNKAGLPAYLRRCRKFKMVEGDGAGNPLGAMAAIVTEMLSKGCSYPSWLLPDLPNLDQLFKQQK
jgi:hypothetical protein